MGRIYTVITEGYTACFCNRLTSHLRGVNINKTKG